MRDPYENAIPNSVESSPGKLSNRNSSSKYMQNGIQYETLTSQQVGEDADSLSGQQARTYDSFDSFSKGNFISEDDPNAIKVKFKDNRLAPLDIFNQSMERTKRSKSYSLRNESILTQRLAEEETKSNMNAQRYEEQEVEDCVRSLS